MLYRDEQGFTVCKRTSEMLGINDFLDAGASGWDPYSGWKVSLNLEIR